MLKNLITKFLVNMNMSMNWYFNSQHHLEIFNSTFNAFSSFFQFSFIFTHTIITLRWQHPPTNNNNITLWIFITIHLTMFLWHLSPIFLSRNFLLNQIRSQIYTQHKPLTFHTQHGSNSNSSSGKVVLKFTYDITFTHDTCLSAIYRKFMTSKGATLCVHVYTISLL